MALIPCFNCSKEISDKVLACPYCEAPEPYKEHDYNISPFLPQIGQRTNRTPYEYRCEYNEDGQLLWKFPYLWQPSGPFEWHYENGQLKEKGSYKDGEYDGPFEGYGWYGQLAWKGTFKDGEYDGPYESYDYETGYFREKGHYDMGEKCGEWLETDDPERFLINWPGKTVTYDPCPDCDEE